MSDININNIEMREKWIKQDQQIIELLKEKISLEKEVLELKREQNKLDINHHNYLQSLLNGGLPHPFLIFPQNHHPILSANIPFIAEPQVLIDEEGAEPHDKSLKETSEAIEAQINAALPSFSYKTIDNNTLIAESTRGIITSTLNVANEFYALNNTKTNLDKSVSIVNHNFRKPATLSDVISTPEDFDKVEMDYMYINDVPTMISSQSSQPLSNQFNQQNFHSYSAISAMLEAPHSNKINEVPYVSAGPEAKIYNYEDSSMDTTEDAEDDINEGSMDQPYPANANEGSSNNVQNSLASNRKSTREFTLIDVKTIPEDVKPILKPIPKPIPKNVARLEEEGLVKTICFDDESDGEIKAAIEKKFPHLKNKDWGFYKIENLKLVRADIPMIKCRFDDLKGVQGHRKKLYVGRINDARYISH